MNINLSFQFNAFMGGSLQSHLCDNGLAAHAAFIADEKAIKSLLFEEIEEMAAEPEIWPEWQAEEMLANFEGLFNALIAS